MLCDILRNACYRILFRKRLRTLSLDFKSHKNIFPLLPRKCFVFVGCYALNIRFMWNVEIFGRYNVAVMIKASPETYFSCLFSLLYETFWPIPSVELFSFILNFTKNYCVLKVLCCYYDFFLLEIVCMCHFEEYIFKPSELNGKSFLG